MLPVKFFSNFERSDMESINNIYFDKGFVKIESVFTENEISQIMAEIKVVSCSQIDGIKIIYEDDRETIRSIMSYHDKNNVLAKITSDNRILKLVQTILQSPVYVSQSKVNIKQSQCGKKWDYHRGLTYWQLLDGVPSDRMVSVFICLSEQTNENGAVYVLSGSHKNVTAYTLQEEAEMISNDRVDDTSQKLSIQIRKSYLKRYQKQFQKEYLSGNVGDVFFMHPSLLHASDDNLTGVSRGLMITVYNSVYNIPLRSERPKYLCEPYKEPLKRFEVA